MKVLLLNTSSHTGGAAVAANRLMKALQKTRINVSMLVLNGVDSNNSVFSVNSSWIKKELNLFRFYWERIIIFLCNHFNRTDLFRVSIANTGNDISDHPLVKEADIIHIHWINQGFLSLKDLQKLFRLGKPIVWTMHDMWASTGICHYTGDCEAYQDLCKQCSYLRSEKNFDLSTKVFLIKRSIYKDADLTFVGCSKWITQKAALSNLLVGSNFLSIPNPIDTSIFLGQDKLECRDVLGLPKDKSLILFGALNVTDIRKGVKYLLDALSSLNDRNVELVVFGQVKEELRSLVTIPIHSMGYITDVHKIVTLYNAVDLFVISSLEDNLPNTIMESMACGTPCVGFNVGGIPEMIDHLINGYVARYKDAEDLAKGISWILNYKDKKSLSDACLKKVRETYAENIVAEKYIELYKQLIENNREKKSYE